MPSRMEKYYNTNTEVKQRSKINEDLYRKIYDVAEYTNIEGIANIEKTNEIDITKIRAMLKNREEYKREKEYRQIIKESKPKAEEQVEFKEEEKNYDIRDILNKAKDERSIDDENYHSLKNTQYNILKGINLKDSINNQEYFEEEEGLKDLINTITNTSMLNKLGDRELSLNMFDELKSTGNTQIGNSKSIRAILEEERQNQQNKEEEKNDIDKSFYTSSLSFKDDDFDELKDINVALKKNNILIKVLLVILLIIIVTGTGYVIYNLLK